MKYLYSGGFTEEELDAYRAIVLSNCVTGIQEIVTLAPKLGLDVEGKNLKLVRSVLDMSPHSEWQSTVSRNIQVLWHDKAIQETCQVAGEHQLQVSNMNYFVENLDRICANNYVPSLEDVLRARQRTTGFVETTFTYRLTNGFGS